MQSKLSDACAYAKKLRQIKGLQKKRIHKKYQFSKSKGRKVIQELLDRYHEYKNSRMMDSDKKINFYKEKNELKSTIKKIPVEASELLSGVNVFKNGQRELKPEHPLGPFICDSSIRLTENELLLLSRGSKFMVRENLSVEKFNVEVKKMICKKKNCI